MIEPFKPITREQAASILDTSLTTLDAMIASGAFPAPRQIGECRRLYWHPDVFYGALNRWLGMEAATTILPAPEPEKAACETRPRKGEAHSEVEPASSDSVHAAPARTRRYGDARARQAARLIQLNE